MEEIFTLVYIIWQWYHSPTIVIDFLIRPLSTTTWKSCKIQWKLQIHSYAKLHELQEGEVVASKLDNHTTLNHIFSFIKLHTLRYIWRITIKDID